MGKEPKSQCKSFEEHLKREREKAFDREVKSLKKGAVGIVENAEKIIGGYDNQIAKVRVTIEVDPENVVPIVSVQQEFIPYF